MLPARKSREYKPSLICVAKEKKNIINQNGIKILNNTKIPAHINNSDRFMSHNQTASPSTLTMTGHGNTRVHFNNDKNVHLYKIVK